MSLGITKYFKFVHRIPFSPIYCHDAWQTRRERIAALLRTTNTFKATHIHRQRAHPLKCTCCAPHSIKDRIPRRLCHFSAHSSREHRAGELLTRCCGNAAVRATQAATTHNKHLSWRHQTFAPWRNADLYIRNRRMRRVRRGSCGGEPHAAARNHNTRRWAKYM